jgi:hypothetical protein
VPAAWLALAIWALAADLGAQGWNVEFVGSYDTPGQAWDVYVAENLAYMADGWSGLQIIDVGNPTSPTLRGSYDTSNYARAVCVTGGVAYLGHWSAGVWILDISDPSHPRLLGSCDTPDDEEDIYVTGGLAYVAGGVEGLHIFDVRDPTQPQLLGYCDTPGDADGIYVSGSLAYLVCGGYHSENGGLHIIDVGDPSSPALRSSYYTQSYARDVQVAGSLAYVANWDSGLRVFDVSDPSSPTLRGTYDTPGGSLGLCLAGSLAYVADHSGGLRVIDVSDPSSPTLRGFYQTPGPAFSVVVAGDLAYVAVWESGLWILRFTGGEPPRIEACVDIKPDTLNLKSQGRWVTCYIELPGIYDVSDINIASLRLDDTVPAAFHPSAVGDYDEDGIRDLMVKFPRDQVIAILEPGEEVEILVTGTVGGTDFHGTDVIRVIDPGIGPKRTTPGETLEFSAAILAEGLTGTVTYRGEHLPAGATLDASTGRFHWTPTPDQVGTYRDVTFRATNGLDEVVESISIFVEARTGVKATLWRLYR